MTKEYNWLQYTEQDNGTTVLALSTIQSVGAALYENEREAAAALLDIADHDAGFTASQWERATAHRILDGSIKEFQVIPVDLTEQERSALVKRYLAINDVK